MPNPRRRNTRSQKALTPQPAKPSVTKIDVILWCAVAAFLPITVIQCYVTITKQEVSTIILTTSIGGVLAACAIIQTFSPSLQGLKRSFSIGARLLSGVLLLTFIGSTVIYLIQSQPDQEALLNTYREKITRLAPNQKDEQAACVQPDVKAKATLQATVDDALKQLDTSHKAPLLHFLYDLCLINGAPKVDPIVVLNRKDLSNVDLTRMTFYVSYLVETNLQGADFREATLSGSDLSGANLRNARHLTRDQLLKVWRLSGAILPDGTMCPTEKNLNNDVQYQVKMNCLQHYLGS